MFTAEMIAPCGLDCSICSQAQKEYEPCPGCNGPDEGKPDFCANRCGIILCAKRKENGYMFCDECPDYPCEDVMEKENRYTSQYPLRESPLENLRMIREKGMEAFLKVERKRWTCEKCGSPINVHTGVCSGCGEKIMRKKIIAVNAGPRIGWNTDTLITEASKGAESAGAIVERYDLFKLGRYTGCISCFGCKKEKNKGHCVCNDGLTPVLDAIREADGLIIGSPNYLSEMTSSFRALYERLIFQSLTYNVEMPRCNTRSIPVLLIMTSNAPDTTYLNMLKNYQQTLSFFVGPTEVLVSGETLQLKDYSKTDWKWTMFDPQARKERHETVFPEEMKKAFEMGENMFA